MHIVEMFQAFLSDEKGQDFAEYALILGAVAFIALAAIPQFRNEVIANFTAAISQLRAARGGR